MLINRERFPYYCLWNLKPSCLWRKTRCRKSEGLCCALAEPLEGAQVNCPAGSPEPCTLEDAGLHLRSRTGIHLGICSAKTLSDYCTRTGSWPGKSIMRHQSVLCCWKPWAQVRMARWETLSWLRSLRTRVSRPPRPQEGWPVSTLLSWCGRGGEESRQHPWRRCSVQRAGHGVSREDTDCQGEIPSDSSCQVRHQERSPES